jgi:hypothetical protein
MAQPGGQVPGSAVHGYQPFSVKVRPRSAAVITAAVYSAVSGGRAAGSARVLLGSPLLPLQFSAAVAVFL